MKASPVISSEPEAPRVKPPPARWAPFSWRALILGLVLCALSIYWICYDEIITHGADLVAMCLIMPAVLALVLLIVVNAGLRRVAPRLVFSQAELLFVYVILSTSLGIGGLGMMQFLATTLPAPFYYATPENHWERWRHLIPAWAFPDPKVANDFFIGHASFFTPVTLHRWLMPVLSWTGFIFVALFCMFCVATLMRRQWVERERLPFPIIIIPLELTQNDGASPIWRNRVFWGGFLLACLVESLASLHYSINPAVPYVPIKPNETTFNLGQYLTTPPWNGVGNLQLSIYPLAVGLSFLLSLEVSLSCWFFYVFLKLENVMAVATGLRDAGAPPAMARIPYQGEQVLGAFLALALLSVYHALPHLKQAFVSAFVRRGTYPDEDEPMPYRWAYGGLAGSFALLVAFGIALGMTWYVAVAFFALFLLFVLALSRIRAEAGLPWISGPTAEYVLINEAGQQGYSASTLVGFSALHWFNCDERTVALPPQVEAMKAVDSSRLNPRHLTIGVLAAVLVATLAGWYSTLTIYYHFGASSSHADLWRTTMGRQGYDFLQNWLANPKPFDAEAARWVAGGFAAVVLLSTLRTTFVWWPLHPIGFCVANTGIDWVWFPLFLGWLSKWLTMRYGGINRYREVLPFFIGLVVGDYLISCAWSLFYMAANISGYRTFPI